MDCAAGAVLLVPLAAGAGSCPREAAMLGFTFTSDSFFGPRGSSALACQQPHTFHDSNIIHTSSSRQRH